MEPSTLNWEQTFSLLDVAHGNFFKVCSGKGVVVLNTDVTGERPWTPVGFKIAGLLWNRVAFFVVRDFLAVEHDDRPRSVNGYFELIPFPRLPLRMRHGFCQ